jgi:hypothetical protein
MLNKSEAVGFRHDEHDEGRPTSEGVSHLPELRLIVVLLPEDVV